MSLAKPLIIDIHGHYTTAPKSLEDWRNRQIAGIQDPALMPKVSDLQFRDLGHPGPGPDAQGL